MKQNGEEITEIFDTKSDKEEFMLVDYSDTSEESDDEDDDDDAPIGKFSHTLC